MQRPFDRAAEDLGNIVALEHVNVTVPDQRLATSFYVTGLGLTRDPYLMTGTDNMWINVGRSQFHLPAGEPQVLRGHVGLVMPGRAALLGRLAAVRKQLDGTRFEFHEGNAFVEATCPWGNRIRCYEPDPRFGSYALGIPYVQFDVERGTLDGIGRFYNNVMGARTAMADDAHGSHLRVAAGVGQYLSFRESDRPLAPYDNHHIQVYIADFSSPYRFLVQKQLVTEESDQHQYRFRDIVDPENGKTLFVIEHEVRSMTHPLYMRPLINRNPMQTNVNYVAGRDAYAP